MLRRLVWVLAPLVPAAVACSSSDDTSAPPAQPVVYDAGVSKAEAGAACATSNDCAAGLACLYPASSCDAFRVCTPAPASPCPQASTVCSCIGHTIAACGGFADEPVDHDGACGDSGTIVPVDSGSDQAAPPPDASDASDAATE